VTDATTIKADAPHGAHASYKADTGRASAAVSARVENLRRQFPTIADLRLRARRRVPKFAFDHVDGGANNEETIARNMKAMSGIEMLPRFCIDTKNPSTEVELFGRRYAAPLGISPMGGGLMWPGTEKILAREAQRRNVPYICSTPGSATIEAIAEIAPDVTWFQLYRFPGNDHAIAFDLVRRADAAGAKVLVPTVDSTGKSKRVRDIRNGFKATRSITASMAFQVATSPFWAWALLRNGMLRPENIVSYTDAELPTIMGGSHTWDELARLRDKWKRAFVVKGILHPADAERAIAIGADGVIVSNHGGRLFDGSPATIDILPAIAAAVGSRGTVMVVSGFRCGLDIVRALALGAKSVFTGRPFLYGLGALGEEGANHVMDLFFDELRSEFQSVGIKSVAEASTIAVRHRGAWQFD
jgi:(S)-mandelate dehydrogenase